MKMDITDTESNDKSAYRLEKSKKRKDDGQHTYTILDEGSDSSNENKTWPRHTVLSTQPKLPYTDTQQKGAIQSGLIRTRKSR